LLVIFAETRNLHRPTIYTSSSHRRKIKRDASADSSKAFTVNRELSIVDVRRFIFLELMLAA